MSKATILAAVSTSFVPVIAKEECKIIILRANLATGAAAFDVKDAGTGTDTIHCAAGEEYHFDAPLHTERFRVNQVVGFVKLVTGGPTDFAVLHRNHPK
jgi:hypothetical protein